MNGKTISKLQYFVGKTCSIFTGPINREFDEVRSREHFVVVVREIDIDALWGTHPYNQTVSFFPISSIKLITEEIVLDPSNPDHARMIREYQEKTGETIVSDVSPHLAPVLEPVKEQSSNCGSGCGSCKQELPEAAPAFVDIAHLSNLARTVKENLVGTHAP